MSRFSDKFKKGALQGARDYFAPLADLVERVSGRGPIVGDGDTSGASHLKQYVHLKRLRGKGGVIVVTSPAGRVICELDPDDEGEVHVDPRLPVHIERSNAGIRLGGAVTTVQPKSSGIFGRRLRAKNAGR